MRKIGLSGLHLCVAFFRETGKAGTMLYMLVKHKVADFAKWHRIFASHAEAQREAGLHLLHLLRDAADPNLVVMLFRVDDPNKAKAFTETPDAREAGRESGVIGTPEISFLND